MSSEGSTVTFRRAPAGLRRGAIERFARKLQAAITRGRAFDCLITGDAELRRLNRDFRGEDHTTDVLSFPAAAARSVPAARRLRPARVKYGESSSKRGSGICFVS